jgi:hypothetical protein
MFNKNKNWIPLNFLTVLIGLVLGSLHLLMIFIRFWRDSIGSDFPIVLVMIPLDSIKANKYLEEFHDILNMFITVVVKITMRFPQNILQCGKNLMESLQELWGNRENFYESTIKSIGES